MEKKSYVGLLELPVVNLKLEQGMTRSWVDYMVESEDDEHKESSIAIFCSSKFETHEQC